MDAVVFFGVMFVGWLVCRSLHLPPLLCFIYAVCAFCWCAYVGTGGELELFLDESVDHFDAYIAPVLHGLEDWQLYLGGIAWILSLGGIIPIDLPKGGKQ